MHYRKISTYEQDKLIFTREYFKRIKIDYIYTRLYMIWEIDSEFKIIHRQTKSNQYKLL